MRSYVDSSVFLRLVLGQGPRLVEWPAITSIVTSRLSRVECLRVLDRLRLTGALQARDHAERRKDVLDLLDRSDVVGVEPYILDLASDAFPSPIGTLDAIHLATALAWTRSRGEKVTMATHDRQLSTAAMAAGLDVIGV